MEYNLINAFKAGFNHVVFVIRPSLRKTLVEQVLARLPTEINVDIVLQTFEDLPSDCQPPTNHTKPLGTAHAVWCCRHVLHSSFAVINADDYYGKQAFQLILEQASKTPGDHLTVSYQLDKTLSLFGSVNRAICKIGKESNLISIEEYENIHEIEGNVWGNSHQMKRTMKLCGHLPVSMNCWCLNPDIFPLLETEIRLVLGDEQSNAEAFLPNAIMKQIEIRGNKVTVLNSSEQWFGVTYPEDVALVNDNIDAIFEKSEHLLSEEIKHVLSNYGINSSQAKLEPLGDGHINKTYKLTVNDEALVLQKINHQIFTSPSDLIQNTQIINQYLQEKVRIGTYEMKVPQQIRSISHQLFVTHNENYWRLMEYVNDSYTVAQVTSRTQAKQVSQAFATFNNALQFLPTEELNTIIKDFHNLDARMKQLCGAIENNTAGRLSNCREIVYKFLDQKDFISQIAEIIPKLPTRITHNDTKINNLLFSNHTNQPCAVIDLDTCMPGYLMHDFGDMVRTCCSNLAEDDPDIDKMVFKKDIFEILQINYEKGFLNSLSEIEKESMLLGAKVLPFIIGARFLTDYLNGDSYFNTTRENQNLDRAKNQFRLFELVSTI